MKRKATRTSISSMFLWDQKPHEMARTITEVGLKGIEFWAETPWYWEQGRRPDLTEVIKKELDGMRITVHAPVMDLNPSSYNDLVHEITIEESLRTIDLAETLGAKIMIIHPGKRTTKRPVRKRDWIKFRRYLDACLDHAQEKKILLALENLEPSPSNMCTNPKEMNAVLEEYSIGMTLDISHATPPLSLALSFVELLADSILNVHVSTTRGTTRHLRPSDGSVDEVLIALRDDKYKGPLTLELDDNKFPAILSKEDKVGVLRAERQHLESIWDQETNF
ncbi:MAG: sugar phosphate isomerase/epimerase family protein [Methanotrichaceae archaeon]